MQKSKYAIICIKNAYVKEADLLQQSPRALGRPRHHENAKPTKEIVLETALGLFCKRVIKIFQWMM